VDVPAAPQPAPAEGSWVEVTASRGLTSWLAQQRVSLAVSTYQTGEDYSIQLWSAAGEPCSRLSPRLQGVVVLTSRRRRPYLACADRLAAAVTSSRRKAP
jgi:hypothetical protein